MTCRGRADPRFLGLLGVVPAFISALFPSRLGNQQILDEFFRPLVDLLLRLLTVSLGSRGAMEPCHELAVSAGTCVGVLLHRLTTFSINLDHVDLLNTESFLTSPAWTPFVTWRDMHRSGPAKRFWNEPTAESFSLANYTVVTLFLPCLETLVAVTTELRDFVTEMDAPPSIVTSSGLTSSSQQREFLSSLITWISLMSVGLMDGLKPRRIQPMDLETVRRVCSELEISATAKMQLSTSITSGAALEELPIPMFDIENEEECLRQRIFRTGLSFMEVLTDLSAKYDPRVLDATS